MPECKCECGCKHSVQGPFRTCVSCQIGLHKKAVVNVLPSESPDTGELAAATPRPWVAQLAADADFSYVAREYDPRDTVATTHNAVDAKHIVHCVNAHDELVAALKAMVDKCAVEYAPKKDFEWFEELLYQARSALYKAKPPTEETAEGSKEEGK